MCTTTSEAKCKAIHTKLCPSDLPKHLKVLTDKQMLQRLPKITQVKAGNTFGKLLN